MALRVLPGGRRAAAVMAAAVLAMAGCGADPATDVSGRLTLQMLRSLAAEHLGYVP